MNKIYLLLFGLFSFVAASAQNPYIQVLAPGEGIYTLETDTTCLIQWYALGVDSVKVEYTEDFNQGFTANNWITVANSLPASAGSFVWTTPSVTTVNIRFRVSSTSTPTIYDLSDYNIIVFHNTTTPIVSQVLLLQPNGGEILPTGETALNIAWTGDNLYGELVEYSSDNGATWDSITSTTYFQPKCINWTIPSTVSSIAKIRVTSLVDTMAKDTSNAVFSVQSNPPRKLALDYPNGGEAFLTNSAHPIQWHSQNVTNVKLEYSLAFNPFPGPAVWTTIVASYPAASGTYNWTLPGIVNSSYMLRISDVDNPGVYYDLSDGTFSAEDYNPPSGQYYIVKPNGGEVMEAGDTLADIAWQKSGFISVGDVVFEYSTDAGSTWNAAVTTSTDNFYVAQWHIPAGINSNQCRVRARHELYPSIHDDSNGNFSISTAPSSKLHLLNNPACYPMIPGEVFPISWIAGGSASNVKLEYAEDYNATYGTPDTWVTIAASALATTGIYNWTVPSSPLNSSLTLRITDTGNNNVWDTREDELYINDTSGTYYGFQIVTPNGGEVLNPGSRHNNLSWLASSYSGEVVLEYSIDGGATWNLVTTDAVQASARDYKWEVPNVNSTQCRVRIRIPCTDFHLDQSNANFTINGNFVGEQEVVAPEDGAALYPNPSTGMLNYVLPSNMGGKVEFNVIDLSGRSLVATTGNGQSGQLDLSSLPNGFYLLRMRSAKQQSVRTFQVQR